MKSDVEASFTVVSSKLCIYPFHFCRRYLYETSTDTCNSIAASIDFIVVSIFLGYGLNRYHYRCKASTVPKSRNGIHLRSLQEDNERMKIGTEEVKC